MDAAERIDENAATGDRMNLAARRQREAIRALSLSMLVSAAIAMPAGARLEEQESGNDAIATAMIQMVVPPDDNVVMSDTGLLTLDGGDIDYLGLSGLRFGDVVELATTPLGDPPFFETPDTIAGLFSNTGTQECVGDDAYNNDLDRIPTGFGSLCRFQVATDGNYYVGVTGFSETPFDGNHFENGTYSLSVSITRLPEPDAALQLASGVLGLALFGARRARGSSEREATARDDQRPRTPRT